MEYLLAFDKAKLFCNKFIHSYYICIVMLPTKKKKWNISLIQFFSSLIQIYLLVKLFTITRTI